MLFDLRLRTSPLVVASDASASGLGVCRASSLEPKGLLALAALQESHNFRGEEIGLIEVGTTTGGVRQAFARLKVKTGAYAIVGARDESKRIIQQTWPDAMVSDASTELTETEITDLMNRATRSDKWLVAGAENEPSSICTTVTFIQKIAASHRAMPEYSVETLFESRNNLSNTERVSVSEKSSLLDMPERDQWQFFHSGSNTNPIPPQLRKFAHRLLLMMLFFFGVAWSSWLVCRLCRAHSS